MAYKSCRNHANSPTLKRSFNSAIEASPPSPDTPTSTLISQISILPVRPQTDRRHSLLSKRHRFSHNFSSKMPVAAGPQQAYHSQFPSFMSVYGLDSDSIGSRVGVVGSEYEKRSLVLSGNTAPLPTQELDTRDTEPLHKHRDSTSTQESESTDSSPTTTISTVDSNSLTDPSPSSSPESPITIVPLSSFSSNRFMLHSLDNLCMSDKAPPVLARPAPMLSLERPMTSPASRKPRNAKGLALNLPSLSGASSPESSNSSLPASPAAFVKPPTMKPRKKPSILSLQTSGAPNPLARLALGDPPPTPGGLSLNLRHHHSTPQLFSPSLAPAGGMKLPGFNRSKESGLSDKFRRPAGLSRLSSLGSDVPIEEENDSPIRHQMAVRSLSDDNIGGDEFDRPQVEDDHSGDYPDGPLCVFDPYLFLYKEPTAEEASEFDAVINVASEVRNPFLPVEASSTASGEKAIPAPKTSFGFGMDDEKDNIPEPSTAMSTATFRTAFEFLPDSLQTPTEASPTTPRPAVKQPDYHHLKWEHNSEVAEEFLHVVKLIDTYVKAGKKVLVHCAQGISRSASLCIAYTVYRNPTLTATEAHNVVKQKSQWIQPNLKLIMQVQAFRELLLEELKDRAGKGSSRIKHGGRSPTKHRNTLSANGTELMEPLTAPLCGTFEMDGSSDSPSGTPSRARGNSSPNFGDITPGPSSAPSSYAWANENDSVPAFGMWPVPTFNSAVRNPHPQSSFGSKFGSAFEPKTEAKESAPMAVPPQSDSQPVIEPQKVAPTDVLTAPAKSVKRPGFSLKPISIAPPPPSKPDEFAGFDFGFQKIEPGLNRPSQEAPQSVEITPSVSPVTPEKTSSILMFKAPSMPGSFPSPTSESPVLQPPTLSFGSLSPGFGSHRKGLRTAPSLPSLLSSSDKKQSPLPIFGSFESRDHFGTRKPDSSPLSPGLFSPRVQETTSNPIEIALNFRNASSTAPAAHTIEPNNNEMSFDDIMSPRATEFTTNPFAMPRTSTVPDVASNFGFSTAAKETPDQKLVIDPRSPPTKGEAPITRSIDDVL